MDISNTYTTGHTVQRNTPTNVGGNETDSWANNLTNVSAHIRQLSGSEVNKLLRMSVEATHRIYTATGQDITEKDRFVMSDGKIFQVVNIDDPHEQGHHLQIDVIRGSDEREQE